MFSSYRGRFAVAIRLIRVTKWEGCFRCIDAGVLKCLGVCGREVLRFLQQSGREGGGEKAGASLAPTFKDCCISAGEDGFPWPGGDGNWDNWDNWDRRCCRDGTHINFEVGNRDGFGESLAGSCADSRDNREPGTLGTGVSVGMER